MRRRRTPWHSPSSGMQLHVQGKSFLFLCQSSRSLAAMVANSITSILSEEIRAIISGLLGGARYGVKIRLPHAFVMTFLFRTDLNTKDKIRTIIRLVWEHTRNLASFVTIYKSLLLSLKLLSRLLRNALHDDGRTHVKTNIWRAIGRSIISVIGE